MKENEENNIKEVSPETAEIPKNDSTTETRDDVEFEEVNEDMPREADDAEWGGEMDAKASIKKLKEKIKKLEQEKADYMNAWTRAQADYINFKKEVEARRKDDMLYASKRVIADILPTLDSFTLARGNKEAWEKVDANWRTGIEYIFGQLTSALEKEGLKAFGDVGEKFDPELHESIEAVPVDTKEQNDTIVAVLQKGYYLHKEILRHAKVKTGHYEGN